jgi:ABC-type polar amino acid transport system ATPase subunit
MSISGVGKAYGERTILNSVTFEVAPGSTHVVIGPSGGGKSTLLRSLAGLETIDSGEIRLGDFVLQKGVGPVKKRPRLSAAVRAQQRRVGMIFQQFDLFPHKTAIQNVELPLRLVQQKSDEEARMLALRELDALGLADHIDKLPSQLSGGQKQRVAIARALAMRPGVLLFDEPTSALDPELVSDVLSIMKELVREGMTMVVVTHEMQFAAEAADSVMFISGGDIVESGPPDELLVNPQKPETQKFLSRLLGH